MEEISLTDTESRYFSDLFVCCDVEKSGKIPILKATELFRSANLQDDVVQEIISLAGIPSTALHISRVQFFSCLKLIAAHQAAMTLRQELIAATLQLPLPRFSWKDSPAGSAESTANSSGSHAAASTANGLSSIPPPPATDRKNSLTRRTDWKGTEAPEGRRNSSAHGQTEPEATVNSDVQSTDSEVEQNESSCGGGGGDGRLGASTKRDGARRRGSPEAWSTNSDSPTPTNSVAERPWAKETLWHGLLGDEHRQLLGTEEESSDRHSSDEDNDTVLDSIYQITHEQRDYYYKQFKTVQHDANGLLSGHVARVFFEKSRIPVEELRHIWQLCDVTRDGALSLAEFTAAMHLVVLRRNNIPLPAVLPPCLYPSALKLETVVAAAALPNAAPQEPPEADLLHLNDDDDEDDREDTTILAAKPGVADADSGDVLGAVTSYRAANDSNIMNISTLSTSSQASTSSRQGIVAIQSNLTPQYTTAKESSVTSSPSAEHSAVAATAEPNAKDHSLWGASDVPPTQWTKFSESPTANISSPGPKPLNFDMQRTAQAVVSDPQILHPVPLRVTPVANTSGNATQVTSSSGGHGHSTGENDAGDGPVVLRESSPKSCATAAAAATAPANITVSIPSASGLHRDSMQNSDLRAIQRPQPKKIQIAKNIGAIPPPPQREPSVGGVAGGGGGGVFNVTDPEMPMYSTNQSHQSHQQQPTAAAASQVSKKEPPPLPPPRPPHRHGRSSSLDLNKFRMNSPLSGSAQPEITAQASFDLQTSTGFADFTQFADGPEQQHSLPVRSSGSGGSQGMALAAPRISLQSNQRVSAFEVYRKPKTPRNSESPQSAGPPPPQGPAPTSTTTTAGVVSLPNVDNYEKRVIAISDTLRHVSFKQNNTMPEVLRHLREQNQLLLRLCNDLSDELLLVQTRKEEIRLKLEAAKAVRAGELSAAAAAAASGQAATHLTRTGSSVSAPVTANVTGGSAHSGGHSNI